MLSLSSQAYRWRQVDVPLRVLCTLCWLHREFFGCCCMYRSGIPLKVLEPYVHFFEGCGRSRNQNLVVSCGSVVDLFHPGGLKTAATLVACGQFRHGIKSLSPRSGSARRPM